ncbi:hypothetical protein L3V30_07095 [Vibrio sp. A1-1]|nr:hypothetical protein [Vibrio sp. A1-1]
MSMEDWKLALKKYKESMEQKPRPQKETEGSADKLSSRNKKTCEQNRKSGTTPLQQNQAEKANSKKKRRRNKTKKRLANAAKALQQPLHLIGGHETCSKKTEHANPMNPPEFKLPEYESPDRALLVDKLANNSNTPLDFQDEISPMRDEDLYLYVGLDFGTAYTKVVIGDESDAYAINFGEHGYLLPSAVYVDQYGNASLTQQRGDTEITELKMPLIMGDSKREHNIAIVMFLALVFKVIRRWPENDADSPYKNRSIAWLINAGIPAENYEDRKLLEKYQRLISAAWTLSYCKIISVYTAREVSERLDNRCSSIPSSLRFDNERLMLLPEFSAQIVGYVQSPQRRKYSHLLIDVGAGTLDIAMFIIDEHDGEWRYKTYDQNLETLGVEILRKYRLVRLKSSSELPPSDLNKLLNDREYALWADVPEDKLREIDTPFRRAVNLKVRDTICTTDKHYTGGPGKFTEKITTFLCGGGRNISVYRQAVEVVKTGFPIEILELPKPERLRTSIDDQEFHRLSVAYGLSFDSFNIGEVVKQKVKEYRQITTERENTYILCPE